MLFGFSNLLDKCYNLYNSGCFFIDILSNIFEFKLERIFLPHFQPVENLVNLDLLRMVSVMFHLFTVHITNELLF